MDYSAKDQYCAMKRSYEKLRKVNMDNGNSISYMDAKDVSTAFFNDCYSLKECLKKDASILLTESVENFINQGTALCLAVDYCNAIKHAGLDRKSRSGKELEKINTHISFDFISGGPVVSARLELTISGKKYDTFSLATDCMKEWDVFLKQNQIVFA